VHPVLTGLTISPGTLYSHNIGAQCSNCIYPGDSVIVATEGLDFTYFGNNLITIDDLPISTVPILPPLPYVPNTYLNSLLWGFVPLLLPGGVILPSSANLRVAVDGIESMNSFSTVVPTIATAPYFCQDLSSTFQDIGNLIKTNCGTFKLGFPLCPQLINANNSIMAGLTNGQLETSIKNDLGLFYQTCASYSCGSWGTTGSTGDCVLHTLNGALPLTDTCKQLYQFATNPSSLFGLATIDGRQDSKTTINDKFSFVGGRPGTSLQLNTIESSLNSDGSVHFHVNANIVFTTQLDVYFYNSLQVCSKSGYTCACLFGSCACFNYPELYNCAGYEHFLTIPAIDGAINGVDIAFDMAPTIPYTGVWQQPVQWNIEHLSAGVDNIQLGEGTYTDLLTLVCPTINNALLAISGPMYDTLSVLSCPGIVAAIEAAGPPAIQNYINNNGQAIQNIMSPLMNFMATTAHDIYYNSSNPIGAWDQMYVTNWSYVPNITVGPVNPNYDTSESCVTINYGSTNN
jgi:hypothetical protein